MCGTAARAIIKGPLTVGVDYRSPHCRICLPKAGGGIEESLADKAHAAAGVVHQDVNRAEVANGPVHHEQALRCTHRPPSHGLLPLPAHCRFLAHCVDFVAAARGRNHHVGARARQS
jgi:hypothetical protein